ncbi:MAG: AAA family ATPase, partial [Kofleriaceae bacterium]
TRIETARSAARAGRLELDEEARRALAAHWLAIGDAPAPAVHVVARTGEVVLLCGMPASGKSTLAADYAARGYLRLNRDERGGSLLDLARALDRALADGADRVIVDNTYPTRASRAPVIELARKHGLPVRCIAMATPLEDAQANAIARVLALHGRLLEPAELVAAQRTHPGTLAPGALFRWRRAYEPPRADEGFAAIEEARSVRTPRGSHRALIVELDHLVWRGRPGRPEAIQLQPGAADALAAWHASHQLAGTTWQPGSDAAAIEALRACLADQLGRPIDVLACTHPAGPPICWCRKPLPGLALAYARARDVDLSRSVHVGRGPADHGFAARAGMAYVEAQMLPPPAA